MKARASCGLALSLNHAVQDFKCPSLMFFGGNDHVASIPVQERFWSRLQANGQPLEWHFFPHAGHGFALGDGDCYDPVIAESAGALPQTSWRESWGTNRSDHPFFLELGDLCIVIAERFEEVTIVFA